MISKKMVKTMNEQINAELYSAYLYLAMSSDCQAKGLKGAAHWFFVQGQEESTHALRIFKYVIDQGERAELMAIAKPNAEFKSLKHMFEETLKHEKLVTSLIHKLVKLAREEDDYASEQFLQWFVKEQVEEEATASEELGKLTMAGDNSGGVFMIDKDLGARVFTPPLDLVIG
jgi:ferritin